MSTEIYDLIKWLAPFFLAGGLPGLIALVRQLKKERREAEKRELTATAELVKVKAEAEQAAWIRAKSTIEDQAIKIQNLTDAEERRAMAIAKLTQELNSATKRINSLESEVSGMKKLMKEKDELIDVLVVEKGVLEARVRTLENGS